MFNPPYDIKELKSHFLNFGFPLEQPKYDMRLFYKEEDTIR